MFAVHHRPLTRASQYQSRQDTFILPRQTYFISNRWPRRICHHPFRVHLHADNSLCQKRRRETQNSRRNAVQQDRSDYHKCETCGGLFSHYSPLAQVQGKLTSICLAMFPYPGSRLKSGPSLIRILPAASPPTATTVCHSALPRESPNTGTSLGPALSLLPLGKPDLWPDTMVMCVLVSLPHHN